MSPSLNLFERFISIFTRVRAGEGLAVAIYFAYACLIIISYYIFKTLREPLIIGSASAEAKSYSTALAALVLLVFVPVYSRLFKRFSSERLITGLAIAFALMGVGFAGLYSLGVSVGYPYYVWVSIYGVVMVAQFWAFANGSFNIRSGKRLFPVILMGASLGGLIGAKIAGYTLSHLGVAAGLLCGSLVIAITACLPVIARNAVPIESQCADCHLYKPKATNMLGGLNVVYKSKLMLLIAFYALFLNVINSTGEYIFAEVVTQKADALGLVITEDRERYIGQIYAQFAFWSTALALFLQIFVVSRIFIHLGVCVAAEIMPLALTLGYFFVGFFPVFTFIYALKTLDNSLDYSLTNTARQALFLPTTHEEKFEAKTTIDTLLWRLGDLVQAGVVFIAIHWLQWGVSQLLFFCSVTALIWFVLSHKLGAEYRRRVREHAADAPKVTSHIGEVAIVPGAELALRVPHDMFVASDPSDKLYLSAKLSEGSRLPTWLVFSPDNWVFSGQVPAQLVKSLDITLTAQDNTGLKANSEFTLKPQPMS